MSRNPGYFIHRNKELLLVNFRGFAKTTNLSNKLERSIPDFFLSSWRIEIEQAPDVPTHSLPPQRI